MVVMYKLKIKFNSQVESHFTQLLEWIQTKFHVTTCTKFNIIQ